MTNESNEEPIVIKKEEFSIEEVDSSSNKVEDTTKEVRVSNNAVVTEPIDLKGNTNSYYRVSLPSTDLLKFTSKLNDFKSIEDNTTPEATEWKKIIEEAVDYYTVGGLYQNRFVEEGSEFKQGVEDNEGNLNSISTPKFKKTEGDIKGELALLKVSKMLGLGDVINIPLPHSGIWVTIKPPTEKDLIDFYNSIFREKIMLGRSTYGLTLSNFSVHINNKLFEFILKHIHSVNYSDMNKEELGNYILIHDFPILAWGFACTMYPNGYDYQRACTTNVEECLHIVKGTINLTKLLWIDNPSLSSYQKTVLSEVRANKNTLDMYRKYISEHTRVVGSNSTTSTGIKFRYKVPTFNEYTADGLNWVNTINSAIDRVVITEDNEEETKTDLLNQYVKSSILRQFSHFIDYIEVEGSNITDRDSINKVLEVMSADDDLRSDITKSILEFKSNTTLALIGIPEYKCPKCGNSQEQSTTEKFSSVIPLDVMSLSFLALTTKISKILTREV